MYIRIICTWYIHTYIYVPGTGMNEGTCGTRVCIISLIYIILAERRHTTPADPSTKKGKERRRNDYSINSSIIFDPDLFSSKFHGSHAHSSPQQSSISYTRYVYGIIAPHQNQSEANQSQPTDEKKRKQLTTRI